MGGRRVSGGRSGLESDVRARTGTRERPTTWSTTRPHQRPRAGIARGRQVEHGIGLEAGLGPAAVVVTAKTAKSEGPSRICPDFATTSACSSLSDDNLCDEPARGYRTPIAYKESSGQCWE